MKNTMQLRISLLFFSCQAQKKEFENRDVVYYFEEVSKEENKERIKQELLVDSLTIADKYLDTTTKKLTASGMSKYQAIKVAVYKKYLEDYLYLKAISDNGEVDSLYFTMTGFYDIEFIIFKNAADKWKNVERLSR